MAEDRREFLIMLSDARTETTLRELRSRAAVLHAASPRVVVVNANLEEAATLRSLPGVTGVFDRNVPSDVLESLEEGEALFVAAWESRQEGREKVRPGEGLPWDASGFEPPDRPVTGSEGT